jgi:hypothetical protein
MRSQMIHSAAQALVLHCARDESAPLSAQRFAQSMQSEPSRAVLLLMFRLTESSYPARQ